MLAESLALSAVLFSIGAIGVLTRRNAIVIFMCVELMLNAVNLTFVALSKVYGMAGEGVLGWWGRGCGGAGRVLGVRGTPRPAPGPPALTKPPTPPPAIPYTLL